MKMRTLRAESRVVVLTGAALLLGLWNLTGLLNEPQEREPELDAQLVGITAARPEAVSDLHCVGTRESLERQARDDQTPVPMILARRGMESRSAQGGTDEYFISLLDRVFGPERFVREQMGADVPLAANRQNTSSIEIADDSRGTAFGVSPIGASPALSVTGPAADPQEARRIRGTEKTYYEDFLAQARKDAKELEHQAEVILRVGGESCQQVAMLRALYAIDPVRALDYFAQAIVSLPNYSRPEGVSVPVFAMDFLRMRMVDPTVRGTLERIAWTASQNVPTELRQQAAAALLATATPVDLQRYASFPAYRTAVAVDDGEAAP